MRFLLRQVENVFGLKGCSHCSNLEIKIQNEDVVVKFREKKIDRQSLLIDSNVRGFTRENATNSVQRLNLIKFQFFG
jgi:hypothetical protein